MLAPNGSKLWLYSFDLKWSEIINEQFYSVLFTKQYLTLGNKVTDSLSFWCGDIIMHKTQFQIIHSLYMHRCDC